MAVQLLFRVVAVCEGAKAQVKAFFVVMLFINMVFIVFSGVVGSIYSYANRDRY
jgi:hypothetical protein